MKKMWIIVALRLENNETSRLYHSSIHVSIFEKIFEM